MGEIAAGALGVRMAANQSITFREAELLINTAPTGSAVIVDINKNTVSIFTAGGRPQIAIDGTAGESVAFNVSTAVDDDVFTVDIDQVGSGRAGENLTVLLWFTAPPV